MGLNARMSDSDRRLYHPGRDVAHNFKHVATLLAARVERAEWAELERMLVDCEVDNEEVSRALNAFVQFIVTSVADPKETMDDVLKRVGWYTCSVESQAAVLAYLGTIMMGMYFDGVREVTLGGVGPCSDTGELQEATLRSTRLLLVPRWRRWLSRIGRRLKETAHAFRGKKKI